MTPETIAELRRLAELANDLPAGSDWLHGEVADGTETVAEWMDKYSAHPDAPAAGLLRVVWSEGSGETKVIVQAIVGDTETAPIRAAFMANANPAVVLALLAEREALGLRGDLLARDLGAAVVRADRAAAERDALAAKLALVRALHFGEYVEDEDRNRCFECGDDWPCPTIRSLDEEARP